MWGSGWAEGWLGMFGLGQRACRLCLFFFFSSRRRHTRFDCDWSSDVCSSDLLWETATLIDIMLLGHWIEMRSVLGASRALEQLVRLLPAEAHRLRADGSIEIGRASCRERV